MKYRLLSFLVFLACLSALVVARPLGLKLSPQNKVAAATYPTYEKSWEEVAKMEKKGRPKSALELVEKIYARAKKEKNAPQQVKAIIHILKYRDSYQENALEDGIKWMEKETAQADMPVKAILQSLLGEYYWNYYQVNHWKVLQRTVNPGDTSADIQAWDARRFEETSKKLYLQSVTQAEQLRKLPVRDFEAILVKEEGSDTLRPTLYDLLMHRALYFLTDEGSQQTKAGEDFSLKDSTALLPAADFIKADLVKLYPGMQDNNSLQALKLYQDLLRFHIRDKQPDAFIDADLARLQYGLELSTYGGKKDDYYKRLLSLEKTVSGYSAAAQVGYWRAQFIYNGYTPAGSTKPAAALALEICDSYIQKYPASYGAKNCEALKILITAKDFSVQLAANQLPGKAVLASVSYKNMSSLNYRVVKVDLAHYEQYSYNTIVNTKELLAAAPIHQGRIELPLNGDHAEHRAEIALPANETGFYVIVLSAGEDFSMTKNKILSFTQVVTELSVVKKSNAMGGDDAFYIMNAATGKAVPGAHVKVFRSIYNEKGNPAKAFIKEFDADKEGRFSLEAENEPFSYALEISKDNDLLPVREDLYLYKRGQENTGETVRTYLFTDRSIYRPGQTVYYKGIVVQSDSKDSRKEVLQDHSAHVRFIDVNGQEIAYKDLKTNEFGSYSGSFVIPTGILNGSMHISDETGSVDFSVEEYKRPSFEVKFNPVYGTYKLNQQVKISGNAASYTGIPLAGTAVKYRVVRNTRFPYWYRWWLPVPVSPAAEIKNGSITTDAEGSFAIQFTALPDPDLSPESKAEFSYTIYADVTDISGETHSSQTIISAGYAAVRASLQLSDWIDKREKLSYRVETENLNGQPIAAKGKLTILKLKEPDRIYRPRLWPAPDTTIMSEQEFHERFPHDPYRNESQVYSYPVEKTLLQKEVTANTALELSEKELSAFDQGNYKAIYQMTDTFGQSVEVVEYFKVYDPKSRKAALNEYSYLVPAHTKDVQPGDKASFIWGTSADAYARVVIEQYGKVLFEDVLHVKNGQKKIEFPIREDYRGGLSLHLFCVNNGRIYSYDESIDVPLPKQDLQISTSAFRSKLHPGEKEVWKLIVKGPDAEKVSAEMMATLYDASLDAFSPHSWMFGRVPAYRGGLLSFRQTSSFSLEYGLTHENSWNSYPDFKTRGYDHFNRFGMYMLTLGRQYDIQYKSSVMKNEGITLREANLEVDNTTTGILGEDSGQGEETPPLRKNLDELAFFYPQLKTDENGEVRLEFTMPEALTRWNFMALAHTKDLKHGLFEESIVTQKELMIQPNLPRFLRIGDKISLTAKVTNNSDAQQNPDVYIKILDPYTNKDITASLLVNTNTQLQKAMLDKGQSKSISWELKVPSGSDGLIYQVFAKSPAFSDGEEGLIPVLPNRMLVTESLPLPIRGEQTKHFSFESLKGYKQSASLNPYRLTLEMTSNPAWYAVQALPYLMEYPYECSEQVFNRFYANTISRHIASSDPKIKNVFESWKNTDAAALQSNLEKNQDVKALLLEQTPWVMEAKDEAERKRRIGQLFDENQTRQAMTISSTKLRQMQQADGGWPWFPGMRSDRITTQYIIAGLGRLEKLEIYDGINQSRDMLVKAVLYTDEQMLKDYQELLKDSSKLEKNNLTPAIISYLYSRSYYTGLALQVPYQRAFVYWERQAIKYWNSQNLMSKAMLAVALYRMDNRGPARDIMLSIYEYALESDEMGMYWKENTSSGYYWYQQPVETQVTIMEAYKEIYGNSKSVEEMKIWLLKQKQTQNWKSTKATADACYGILMQGNSLLSSTQPVKVTLGSTAADPLAGDGKIEAGTGYYKQRWDAGAIKPDMGNVTVSKEDKGIAWGALYFQYFEDMDKVKSAGGGLSIKKQLFVQENTKDGPRLTTITDQKKIMTGDLVKVRIEIRADRNLEYVHMQDMRAAALEPTETLSGYRYQGGLGYYQSLKDASVNFFFDYLPKGTYVFEYSLRANLAGSFQNGIATIQCMYAPEFSSHSEGIRLEVVK